jgi:hypothetical protein
VEPYGGWFAGGTSRTQVRTPDLLERDLAVTDEVCRAAPLDLRRGERELRARLDDWRGLLRRHVAQGRQILRKLLETPLTFTPVIGRAAVLQIRGEVRFDRLIAGLALPQVLASPTGFEPPAFVLSGPLAFVP